VSASPFEATGEFPPIPSEVSWNCLKIVHPGVENLGYVGLEGLNG